jgi:hypothetical protein
MTTGSFAGKTVKTLDDGLRVFEKRELGSAVRFQPPPGFEIRLGAVFEVDGREWIEAALPDGTSGYVLGSSARSHTAPVTAAKAGTSPVTEAVGPAARAASKHPSTAFIPECLSPGRNWLGKNISGFDRYRFWGCH